MGAHARSSERRRDGSVDPFGDPSDIGDPSDGLPHDGLDDDRDYGEVLRSPSPYGPAPLSPPVGFPSAFSSGSFRSTDRSGAPEPPPVPAQPPQSSSDGPAASGGRPPSPPRAPQAPPGPARPSGPVRGGAPTPPVHGAGGRRPAAGHHDAGHHDAGRNGAAPRPGVGGPAPNGAAAPGGPQPAPAADGGPRAGSGPRGALQGGGAPRGTPRAAAGSPHDAPTSGAAPHGAPSKGAPRSGTTAPAGPHGSVPNGVAPRNGSAPAAPNDSVPNGVAPRNGSAPAAPNGSVPNGVAPRNGSAPAAPNGAPRNSGPTGPHGAPLTGTRSLAAPPAVPPPPGPRVSGAPAGPGSAGPGSVTPGSVTPGSATPGPGRPGPTGQVRSTSRPATAGPAPAPTRSPAAPGGGTPAGPATAAPAPVRPGPVGPDRPGDVRTTTTSAVPASRRTSDGASTRDGGPSTAVAPTVGPDDSPAAGVPGHAGPSTRIAPIVDDEDDDSLAEGPASRAARPTRAGGVPQRARTRAERRSSTTTASPSPAWGEGDRAAEPRTTRSAARRSRPSAPRGRVAAAVVAIVAAVAAKVSGWPGGERVVRAGRWVREKAQRYLDGPDPGLLTATALRWRRGRRLGYAGLGAMVGVPVLMLVVGWVFIPIPNADEAVESQLNTVAFSDGTVLARIAPGEQGNRQKVDIGRVPKPVQLAVLSAEDRSFYSNSGFDVQGIARAVVKNLTGGQGGGSTITQQYVKNAMVGDEYSLVRKYKELIISSKISQERSKDQILGDYLNSIYFGRGAYGIQAASQGYFGRPVETLTPAEGALLAGIIQSPSRWDPAVKYDDSVRRWNYVMDGMVAQGWLPAPERAAAQFPPTVPPRKAASGVPDDDRGHIYSAVKTELKSLGIDEDALVTEGLRIQTSINPGSQKEAVEAVRKEMARQPGNLRSSVVSIDPRDGSILAYYGGDNGSGLDYAQVEKQAGSTFKPFVLLAALQQDPPIGLSTEFDGQSIPGETVRNVDGADCAQCNLKKAMTLSNNVVFTALGNKVGPQAIAAAARQAGVTQKLENPTSGIALGSAETTPVDMASAYATFANDGVYNKPHLVQKVTTASGDVLYDHAATQGEQRIDPKVARNVTEAMRDVPEYDGAALSGDRPAAAKTGTVQSYQDNQNNDAWMVGYTPTASTTVWVGTDDNTPIQTTDRRPIYGHGLPSEIWQAFMDESLDGTPKQSFGSFTPVAGSDPGETATGEGKQEGASSPSPPSTSASSSAPGTRSAPSSTSSAPAVPTTPGAASEAPAEPATPAAPAAPAAREPAAVEPGPAAEPGAAGAAEEPVGGN